MLMVSLIGGSEKESRLIQKCEVDTKKPWFT